MIQRIGLCGSHRTGKTTLAEAVSNEKKIPFVKTSTSAVFAENGLDPAEPMDFETRLWIQHKVVDAAEEIWKKEGGAFVTDRTPIDMMAYTLADIQGDTDVDCPSLNKYLDHCFAVTNKYFTALAVVQPGIPLVYESGKAALNMAYMEHLNTLIIGLCGDERLVPPSSVIERNIIGIGDRVRCVLFP